MGVKTHISLLSVFKSDSVRTTVRGQIPDDGIGDVIIDLPPDILAGMSVGLVDSLTI